MASRTQSRKLAVQCLYQHHFSLTPLEQTAREFWQQQRKFEAMDPYAQTLIEGVVAHRDELTQEIDNYLINWSPERLILLVRLILEISLFELIHRHEVPWKVVIDEAIYLTKAFCGEEFVSAVNGLLHEWHKQNQPGE
jgi:N utilization substance protein B